MLYRSFGVQGSGVFTDQEIKSGEKILEFTGSFLQSSEIPRINQPEEDRFVQIAEDGFLGPSGNLDDYINHSCNPNTGLVFQSSHIFLKAIRDILPGEEITWDYSTTMFNDNWTMECRCGSVTCRGQIGEFRFLPPSLRKYYIDLGIIPPYNVPFARCDGP